MVAGLGYWALSAPTVTAQCVREDANGQPVIVQDELLHRITPRASTASSSTADISTGTTTAARGPSVRGPSAERRPPQGATVKTKSGSTIRAAGLVASSGGGRRLVKRAQDAAPAELAVDRRITRIGVRDAGA